MTAAYVGGPKLNKNTAVKLKLKPIFIPRITFNEQFLRSISPPRNSYFPPMKERKNIEIKIDKYERSPPTKKRSKSAGK